MKTKQNKILQKIAIILAILISFSFIVPTKVVNASVGGALYQPIATFTTLIADIIMNLVEQAFTGDILKSDIIEEGIIDGDFSKDNVWRGTDAKVDLPHTKMNPEAIFSNKVELLNIDFINPIDANKYDVKNDTVTTSLKDLRKTIASWYVALRNLSLVMMLSILVYVAIRIIISSASSDKAKYKELLKDWIIGMALLFTLHYIMAFTIMFTEKITEIISPEGSEYALMDIPTSDNKNIKLVFNDKFKYNGKEYKKGDKLTGVANLTDFARLYSELYNPKKAFAYLVIYIVLIFFTIKYAFTYLKRVLTMAFLTMIAPLVAMTYPIDKMNDGKAQAFNFWLKEYIYNSLIQPFHLLLYVVFVSSAIDLARSNLIYPCVVLFFMGEAEKILRKMFGFEKAGTLPGMGKMAAAQAMGRKFADMIPGKNKKGLPGGKSDGGDGKDKQPRMQNQKYDFGNILGNNEENSNPLLGDGVGEEGINGLEPGQDDTYNDLYNEDMPLEDGVEGFGSDLLGDVAGGAAMGEMFDDEPVTPINNDEAELMYAQNRILQDQADNNQVDNNLESEEKENSNKNNKDLTLRNKAGLLGKHAFNRLKDNITDVNAWKNFGTRSGRFALKSLGAIEGGIIGGAVALANGDSFSDVVTGVGAGIYGGRQLGDAAANLVGRTYNAGKNAVEGVTDFKNEAIYGYDEAENRRKEREDNKEKKEYINDRDNRRYFERKGYKRRKIKGCSFRCC